MAGSVDGVGAQSGDHGQPQPQPSDLPISSYREQGLLWAWTARRRNPVFSPMEGAIRGLSCYQYTPDRADPVISNVELKESEVEHWLGTIAPSENGREPCGGYKILQFDAEVSAGFIGMKSDTFEAVNKAFGLPPVELHASSAGQGGCGMFREEDGSFGKNASFWSRDRQTK